MNLQNEWNKFIAGLQAEFDDLTNVKVENERTIEDLNTKVNDLIIDNAQLIQNNEQLNIENARLKGIVAGHAAQFKIPS